MQMEAQDKQILACKQAITSALCGERPERRNMQARNMQALNAWIHTSHDLEWCGPWAPLRQCLATARAGGQMSKWQLCRNA